MSRVRHRASVAFVYSFCERTTAHPQMGSNFVSKSPPTELSLTQVATPPYSYGYESSLRLAGHERSLATDGRRSRVRTLTFRQRTAAGAMLLAALIMLGGCSLPGRSFHHKLPSAPDSAPQNYSIIGITPALVVKQDRARGAADRANLNESLKRAIDKYHYRVGAQDVLSVVVWDHPELTLPLGQYRSAEEAGYVVRADGTIFYPYVGRVPVAGKTTEEIRIQLTTLLEPYLKNPQLNVRVVGFHSKKFQLAGAIVKPGLYPITNIPLTVSQAIAQTGGVLQQGNSGNSNLRTFIPRKLADLAHVLLIRNGTRQALNLRAFYQHGDQSQDRLIQADDIIEVPDNAFTHVHLIGELREPGNYPMNDGELNLAQALGAAGGLDLTTADASGIFVFRGARDKPQVFWLNSGSPEAMLLATRFQLEAQDVVYVSTSDLSRFDRIVRQILPTVQTLWQTHVLVNQ